MTRIMEHPDAAEQPESDAAEHLRLFLARLGYDHKPSFAFEINTLCYAFNELLLCV